MDDKVLNQSFSVSPPDRDSLLKEYDKYLPARTLVVRELEKRIKKAITPLFPNLRVNGRVKSFESYFKKYLDNLKSDYGCLTNTPAMTDLIGIRIICLFTEDLAAVEKLVKEEFKIIEKERKGDDHTFREFGYESIHLLISLPENIIEEGEEFCCEVAELQVRTILQDAWAEVEHELIYKSEFTPYDNPLKRKLAAVSAFLFLADNIFQEVRSHQRELNGELRKKSNSFFRKVEESTDALLLNAGKPLSEDESLLEEGSKKSQPRYSNTSIDDLLLQALSAHNKNQFPQAIAVYSQILEMKTDDTIRSLIYKHRGMAFFACSNYEEAIADFSESLKLDPNSYKAAYYEGIVCSVVRRYPQAVDAFNRSLTINPYQQYCLFRRGQAYFHLEDYPKALGDCEAALSLEPFEAARKFKSLVLAQLKM